MNLQELLQRQQGGEAFTYIPFWGGEMSQWYPSPIKLGNDTYLTAEHYMMAEKAKTFGDFESLAKIQNTIHPSEAKKLGRQVKGFNDAEWDKVKYDVVVRANVAKFQIPELFDFLRWTGDAILVEASPYDRVWGIGMMEDDPGCHDPRTWKGQNLLGFAIMDARSQLGL